MRVLFFFLMYISLIGCEVTDKSMSEKSDSLIDALIIGSAESPDPVLKRVDELEKRGRVRDVVVYESSPLQIHLKATAEVIEELSNIPRIEGNLR